MKFSINLKKFITTKNLSLKELAEQLDVPSSTVHGWVNGVPPKSVITLKKIAMLMNCSVDELCFEDKDQTLDPNIHISIGSTTFKIFFKKIEAKEKS